MSLILKAAHQFHRFFPFAQLRTANWILKRNPNGELMPAKPCFSVIVLVQKDKFSRSGPNRTISENLFAA